MDWAQQGVESTDAFTTPALTGAAGTIPTAILDVRSYAGYYLTVQAQVAAATKYNPIQVFIEWLADPLGATVLLTERYGFLARSTTAGFVTYGGRLNMSDQIHGPYVRVSVFIPVGTDTLSGTVFSFSGTTRPINSPVAKEMFSLGTNPQSADNYVVYPANGTFNIGGGGTITIPGLTRVSQCKWHLFAGQGVSMIVYDVTSGGTFNDAIDGVSAATGTYTGNFFLPQVPTIWQITNTGGVAGIFNLSVMAERGRLE